MEDDKILMLPIVLSKKKCAQHPVSKYRQYGDLKRIENE